MAVPITKSGILRLLHPQSLAAPYDSDYTQVTLGIRQNAPGGPGMQCISLPESPISQSINQNRSILWVEQDRKEAEDCKLGLLENMYSVVFHWAVFRYVEDLM